MLACHTREACLGGVDLSADSFCAPSQQGPYCAVCREGYFGGGDGALCKPCEGSSFLTFLPAMIILAVALALLGNVVYAYCCTKLGLTWTEVGTTEPEQGAQLSSPSLAEALKQKTQFTEKEWRAFGIAGLRSSSCIQSGGLYFQPARTKTKLENMYPMASARLGWLKDKANGLLVKLKILISLYQIMQGVGIVFDIQWPELYDDVLKFLSSIFQIDLVSAMPINCVANLGFFGSLVIRTVLPLLLIVLLSGVSKLFGRYHPDISESCAAGRLLVLFLVYPSCSSAILQTFMCDELDDGSAFLRVDYSVKCYSSYEEGNAWDPSFVPMMIYAALMTCVFPIGTPLLYAAMFYANYNVIAEVVELELKQVVSYQWKLKLAEDELCKELRPGSDQLCKETDALREKSDQLCKAAQLKIRRDKLGKGSLSKLTDGYEMRVYWFEVFECVRKISLVGLPIFVEHGSATQLIFGLLICFFSFGMYVSYEPYIEASDDRLSKVCQASLFFSLVSSIVLKMEPDNSTETLGVILLFTVIAPPVLAILFESDLDFGKICHLTKVKKGLLLCFNGTIGRGISRVLGPSTALVQIMAGEKEHSDSAEKQSAVDQRDPPPRVVGRPSAKSRKFANAATKVRHVHLPLGPFWLRPKNFGKRASVMDEGPACDRRLRLEADRASMAAGEVPVVSSGRLIRNHGVAASFSDGVAVSTRTQVEVVALTEEEDLSLEEVEPVTYSAANSDLRVAPKMGGARGARRLGILCAGLSST